MAGRSVWQAGSPMVHRTNEGPPSVEQLKARIEEIRQRIPPHSIPPAMLEELESLEEQLEEAEVEQGG
jgi:hypothetical protein